MSTLTEPAAYRQTNLELRHDFHETEQGARYKLSGAARREVLGRLLQLNHQPHPEEFVPVLHGDGKLKSNVMRGGERVRARAETGQTPGKRDPFDGEISHGEALI